MTNFRKRLLLAGVVTLVLLLGGMGSLFWMQPWRPDWQTVQVRTQEHVEQAGFERPRITSDDFRWRYSVRAAKGPKQFVAHVELGLLWPSVEVVRITTPEDGASRLSVSVYYRDSSVFLVAHRFHENGEAAIVSLGEPQQAVSRSEADELASLVMRA
jgi:hypothetical protein